MRSHDAGGVQEWREALEYSPRMNSAEGGEVGRLLAHFLQVCKVWEGQEAMKPWVVCTAGLCICMPFCVHLCVVVYEVVS